MLLRSTVALLLHATVSSAALIIRLPNLLPPLGHVSGNHSDSIFARQKNGDDVSTCGYLNGDPSKPRTANAGYNCRVDTQNGLWGFCPTSVIAASDCGLAGSCVDDFKCSKGCGFVDKTQLTTITCESKQKCATAILTAGVDQTYTYLACGGDAITDHYQISPTAKAEPEPTTKETSMVVSKSDSPSSRPQPSQSQTQPSSTLSTTSHTTEPTPSSKQTTSTVANATSGAESSNPNSAADSETPNNIGLIVGGVLGGLALLCLSTVAIFYLWRRNQKQIPASTKSFDHSPWNNKSETMYRPSRHVRPHEMPGSSIQPPRYAELAS